jgi:putative flippase GtrA
MIDKLLLKKTNNAFIQAFRYIFAGAIGFTADFLVLFVLTHYAHLYYLFSATLGFISGVTVTYILSVYWVFQVKTSRGRLAEFILFVFIGLLGLALTIFLLWIFTEKFHFYYLVSKVIATVIVYFWNFLARKNLLFKNVNDEILSE